MKRTWWKRWRGCAMKRRFNNTSEAWAAMHTRRYRGVELGIYPCYYCGGWHFTKQLPKEPETCSNSSLP